MEKHIKTLHGFNFGEPGPYKLAEDANPAFVRIVWDYTQRESQKAITRRHRAAALAAAQNVEVYDALLASQDEPLMMARASATRAFYNHGRWLIVMAADWYCYLSPGVDGNGDKYEPYLVAGRSDGKIPCPSCDGCGRRLYRADLGSQPCFSCSATGFLAPGVPRTVKQSIEHMAAARLEVAHVD